MSGDELNERIAGDPTVYPQGEPASDGKTYWCDTLQGSMRDRQLLSTWECRYVVLYPDGSVSSHSLLPTLAGVRITPREMILRIMGVPLTAKDPALFRCKLAFKHHPHENCDGNPGAGLPEPANPKLRTCLECKHIRPRNPSDGVLWHACKCPVPPWASNTSDRLYDSSLEQTASDCPCYERKQ